MSDWSKSNPACQNPTHSKLQSKALGVSRDLLLLFLLVLAMMLWRFSLSLALGEEKLSPSRPSKSVTGEGNKTNGVELLALAGGIVKLVQDSRRGSSLSLQWILNFYFYWILILNLFEDF
ncbi:hypothetical protein PanWU01x14_106130 [Parasponia andersonii]|uniref:Transmembrane protein n=1 Tax=Parasponia andersonii TaxID=3476 RepID=A0A2P5D148_PARAD|nr:hypothetical protein PanWU01x14_106130 [Parasponia andersonii]